MTAENLTERVIYKGKENIEILENVVCNEERIFFSKRRLTEEHLGLRGSLRVLPLTPTHQRLCSELCRARLNYIETDWNQVIFSNESRFNLSNDDYRVRVWRPRGERLNPSFALHQHTTSIASVMVWGVIVYNTRCHFSTSQCSASHGKGVTRLSPSLTCPIPRFISNQAYPSSLLKRVGHSTI
ncbi:transposable element Tcb1 transposase [Trichonephila clavipes]|uniref:Transposable element Tcb1 transposase n=1 Tax=Trichonephila clavipes TaxID=2585209 RepID=A0A8X6V1N7_TRICX|nr:transposable element Tcb1 transposase [Trichonephila clavipes]